MLNVILINAFITTKHVLPNMHAMGEGSIMNIGSMGGVRYLRDNSPGYLVTKGDLRRTTVNSPASISEGYLGELYSARVHEMPMTYQQIAGSCDSVTDVLVQRSAVSPTGPMGDSFDVAGTGVLKASEESRYVSGICICWMEG